MGTNVVRVRKGCKSFLLLFITIYHKVLAQTQVTFYVCAINEQPTTPMNTPKIAQGQVRYSVTHAALGKEMQGQVIGGRLDYVQHMPDGRNVRTYAVAVLWNNGTVTVEDADNLNTLPR